MNKYDIYLATVSFIDRDGVQMSKVRPVMILNSTTAVPIASPITSHSPRAKYNGDYAIQDWKQAGLSKPSTLRLNYVVDNSNGVFLKQIGRLSTLDIQNIKKLLPQVSPKNLR